MKLNTGVLLAFEGIDGSGKTTQANLLVEQLQRIALTVLQSKEPTSGPWGQKIRESKRNCRMDPHLELQAFLNDRRDHVTDLLAPALARGEVVVLDRYYYSTVAYQGARGLDVTDLMAKNESFAPRPDLVIILDVDPETALSRISARGDTADLFEKEDNLRGAREIFLDMRGEHVMHVDGRQPIIDIHMAVLRRLYRGPLRDFIVKSRRDVYSWVGEEGNAVAPDLAQFADEVAADRRIPLPDKAAELLKRIRAGR